MRLQQHEIKTYVTADDYKQITTEANTRRTSLAKVLRDCIREYFLLRNELAHAIESQGELGDNHSGKLIHTLLARTEERFQLAITDVENQLMLMEKQMKFITTMIDQLHWNLMYHLPPVHQDLQEVAVIKARQRHQQWLEKLKEIVAKGGKI